MKTREAKSPTELSSNESGGPIARSRTLELDPLDDAFGFLIRRAWRDIERRFQHNFRIVALTPLQYSVMILLERNTTCMPGELVQPLGISQNNLVGIVDELIERGFVAKQIHAEDRRARVLTLTKAGHEVLLRAHAAHDLYTQEFVERVGGENLRELTRLLKLFDPD